MLKFLKKPSCKPTPDGNCPCCKKKVALVGNPNVGKSVLFNALTGAYVTVSNYPGTSVEVARGSVVIDGVSCQIIDTPGMYSILPITEEERVAREILLHESPDLVVHVLDARNLERMLAMTIQLIEAGLPVILVVNIMDEAERLGISIDIPALEKKLGIPVIAAAAAKKRGLPELKKIIASHEASQRVFFGYGKRLEADLMEIMALMSGSYSISKKAIALLLLQRDEEVEGIVREREKSGFTAIDEKVREKIFAMRSSFHLELSLERKAVVRWILEGVFHASEKESRGMGERLSSWAVRPLTGIPLLLAALYFGLYKFVGEFGAGTLVDFLEGVIFEGYISPWMVSLFNTLIPWETFRELFVGEYGIVTLGLRYAVGIILPIVTTFFLFFSILEDSGYFPRLALLVDRLFKKIGLTGRAVIPMVLGFGCDTMATMVTRTLETVRERIIATILLALAIPCSAQLGVILALLATFPGALAVWSVFMVLVFLLVGLLASRVVPGESPMFYMELPPMRLPQFTNVLTKTYSRVQWYLVEIIPLFILASFLLWLGKITNALQAIVSWMKPIMAAIGLPGETAVAFIFGFFRRDYGAAGLYDLQTSGLLNARQLTVAAVTLTLFVPCVAQFLIMMKERGTKVAVAIAIFVSIVAFGSGYLLNEFLLLTGIL